MSAPATLGLGGVAWLGLQHRTLTLPALASGLGMSRRQVIASALGGIVAVVAGHLLFGHPEARGAVARALLIAAVVKAILLRSDRRRPGRRLMARIAFVAGTQLIGSLILATVMWRWPRSF